MLKKEKAEVDKKLAHLRGVCSPKVTYVLSTHEYFPRNDTEIT